MLAVGFAVAVPLTLLIDSGGDSDGSGASPGTETVPGLEAGASDEGLGVRYRLPQGWVEEKKESAIRLRSPDASAEIVIAAPAPAAQADAVLDDALAAIRRGYEDVEVTPGAGRQIGGLDAKGAVITATADRTPLRIVVAVAPGGGRAYLVEVFTAAGIEAGRLREAQVALNSLRLGE
jgi:hypothetical protein